MSIKEGHVGKRSVGNQSVFDDKHLVATIAESQQSVEFVSVGAFKCVADVVVFHHAEPLYFAPLVCLERGFAYPISVVNHPALMRSSLKGASSSHFCRLMGAACGAKCARVAFIRASCKGRFMALPPSILMVSTNWCIHFFNHFVVFVLPITLGRDATASLKE